MATKTKESGRVKVKMLVSLAGIGFSYKIGEIVEVDSVFASQIINAGYASKV